MDKKEGKEEKHGKPYPGPELNISTGLPDSKAFRRNGSLKCGGGGVFEVFRRWWTLFPLLS